jgi:myosin heavy subunit
MAKCIYGALFDWIVLKVNQALLTKKHNSDHEVMAAECVPFVSL